MQKIVLILFGAAMTMLLSSCSPGDERNHPLFRKAENAQKTGQTAEAVGFYKELLKRRGNCVYAHLNLATIYDESLNDPQMAALHYRLYLEGNPNAVDAAEVKAWQKNAEKRYYESLQSKFAVKTPPQPIVPTEIKLEIAVDMPPEKPADFKQKTVEIIEKELNSVPLPDLQHFSSVATNKAYRCTVVFSGSADKNTVLANVQNSIKRAEVFLPAEVVKQGIKVKILEPVTVTAEEIAAMRKKISAQEKTIAQYQKHYRSMLAELLRLRRAVKNTSTQTAPNTKLAATGGSQTYKVVSGDNPGKIARKFYGKSSLYYLILNANPKVDGRSLKPGTILVIPEYKP